MFERFTDRARRVVVLAQEEARLLNHHHIGTEHLLLGLVREEEGLAAHVLVSLGLRLDVVRERVAAIVGPGEKAQPSGHIPFTPRAKRVLELSLPEALQLGHDYIGTEHILLGLVEEGGGVAVRVMTDLELDVAGIRSEVIRALPEVRAAIENVGLARTRRAARLPEAELIESLSEPVAQLSARLARVEARLSAVEAEAERLLGVLRAHGLDADDPAS